MTNVNESELDLGLALGVTNQCVESLRTKNISSSTGAGANANTRLRVNTLTFVGHGPLTELVWSTQNGLSIKCADKKPSQMGFSPSPDTTPFLGSNLGHTGQENQTTADLLPLLANEPEILQGNTENIGVGTGILGLDIGLPLKIQERPEPDLPSHVEKMEETGENDVQGDQRGEDSLTDGSHGSMESCNSANLLSKTEKRWRFEEQLILGSKRTKKQTQECPPVVKQDSSFMSWISNMVKGLKPNQEEDHSLADDKTLSFGSKRMGFQTVFQSLYSPDAKPVERRTHIDNKSISDSKEIVLADTNPSGSLWITRLSPKTPTNHSNLKSFVAKYSSFDDASASVGFRKLKKPVALKTPTCFFCGKAGHGLHDCLEINEKELEDVLNNISLYEGVAKEVPCLCIKCFQLNHWASVCTSKKSYSLINTKESRTEKKVSNMNEIGSSSRKNKLSLDAPKHMFDTIRRLRLSRTDILKWTNSRFPITNLDGFFLRLRLAKWEEEVGGAGYYVACITGSQGEDPLKGSKKPIRVDIGGVECLVESRYVSNCDFLEDELVAWWQKTSIIGRIPMEEDLNSKMDERKKFGF